MILAGGYIHDIDPVIGTIFGVHLWWYGLSYTLGFLNAHLFLKRKRKVLRLGQREVWDLSLLLAVGVLAGGRLVEVFFYEWPFYSENMHLIPALWLGGMASHGLLLGGLVAVLIFCRISEKSFLMITDALAIPAAFILGMGRIGNFIDGQIVGSVTDVWWAVKFPDADGYRHPVVLYDGIKNLLIIPVIAALGRFKLPYGVATGVFVFLYSFLRIPVDIFREYPTNLLGLATGQVLNIAFSLIGLLLIILPIYLRGPRVAPQTTAGVEAEESAKSGIGWRRSAFVSILLFSLIIPSDWTQDIPARYGKRHPNLTYSALYPRIAPEP